MLHVDIPSQAEIVSLAAHRGDLCVSIYLPTTPLSQQASADRIALKNLARDAVRQLEDAGADRHRIAALSEEIDDLIEDDDFWRFQAHGLAVLATPDNLRTFRVASTLPAKAEVSDRFHLKPLLRAVTFHHAAYVLALAENSVRLVEVSPDLPAATVRVEGLPADAASAVGKASIKDRAPRGRLQGHEGQKVRLRQFARKVDQAVRGVVGGTGVPLILAAAQPLDALYRSVNSNPDLAAASIDGNPETSSDAELARRARVILDDLHRAQLAEWTRRFATRENQGRATTDVAMAARAATLGAVDSLLVDFDQTIPGTVDEETGAVAFSDAGGAGSYGVVDEIARRVILSQGRVLAVRAADVPHGKPLAAILRYPV